MMLSWNEVRMTLNEIETVCPEALDSFLEALKRGMMADDGLHFDSPTEANQGVDTGIVEGQGDCV